MTLFAGSKLSIYISGAHSAGKTTLQEALQRDVQFTRFGFKSQQELAREWVQKKGYTQEKLHDPSFLFQLQQELVNLQIEKENSEISDCEGLYHRFLWDRGILDPIIYAKELCGHKDAEELVALPAVKKELSRLQAGDDTLVVIPQPHRDFLCYDGVRIETSMDEILRIHNSIIAFAYEMRIPHVVVKDADLSKRTEFVIEQVISKWPWLVKS